MNFRKAYQLKGLFEDLKFRVIVITCRQQYYIECVAKSFDQHEMKLILNMADENDLNVKIRSSVDTITVELEVK